MSAAQSKTGRNDPCPCGSGRKYKHCHYGEATVDDATRRADNSGVLAIGAVAAVVVGAALAFAVDVTTGVGVGGGVMAAIGAWVIFRDPPPPKAGGGDPAAINFGV